MVLDVDHDKHLCPIWLSLRDTELSLLRTLGICCRLYPSIYTKSGWKENSVDLKEDELFDSPVWFCSLTVGAASATLISECTSDNMHT